MQKTKIPWADYTINPVKGLCPMACSYCYARRMYKRFKWNPEIRFDQHSWRESIHQIAILKKPSRIFVGSTFELFGEWNNPDWMHQILEEISMYKAHTFIFLTKQPQNLIKWSPFPENCWVGVSVTGNDSKVPSLPLYDVRASVRFISLEPLLSAMPSGWNVPTYINWLILGSRTQPTQHPPREWVDEIIAAADKAKIPIFVKEPMASHYNIHRQEFPCLSVKKSL